MIFSCIKQPPSNFTRTLSLIKCNEGVGLLLGVVGGLILSSDNPLDFHAEILSLLPIFLK